MPPHPAARLALLVLVWVFVAPALFLVVAVQKGMLGSWWGAKRLATRPSATAELVCGYRWLGTLLGLVRDEYAGRFLTSWDLAVARLFAFTVEVLGPLHLGDVPAYVIARTLAIDDFLARRAPSQVVLLGAGLDARAFRLNTPHTTFFEVDMPTTQMLKRQLLTSARATHAAKAVHFISCDFSAGESFIENLVGQGGFDPSNPNTVFVMEGVASYLTWAELSDTLRKVATCAPGVLLALTILETTTTRKTLISRLIAQTGEQWKFALQPSDTPEALFLPLGFDVLHPDSCTVPEMMKRFLPSSYMEGRRMSSGIGRMLFLRVRG